MTPRATGADSASRTQQPGAESDPLVGHPEEGRIRDTWLQVREHLDAEEEHQAFIQECARLGLLNFAGQCCRELMDRWPDDERVSDYRTRVINAAMAQAGRLEVECSDTSVTGAAVFDSLLWRADSARVCCWILSHYAISDRMAVQRVAQWPSSIQHSAK